MVDIPSLEMILCVTSRLTYLVYSTERRHLVKSEVVHVHFQQSPRAEVPNHVKLRSAIALASRETCDPIHRIPCDDQIFGPAPRKIVIAFHLPVDLQLSSRH